MEKIEILKKRSKKLRFFIIALIIIIAVSGGIYYFVQGRGSDIQYKTAEAKRRDIRSTIQATGTLNPVETVDVGTQISGKIVKLYFDYNSVVKEGQLIAIMDPSTLAADTESAAAALMQAHAEKASAEAALDVAAKDLARTRELSDRDLIAKSQLDADTATWLRAKASLAAAKDNVARLKAMLDKAQVNLNYTKIYSPVDGVVVAKNVEEGQTVAASYQTPSIAKIARDLTQMQVEVNVDEADIGGVHDGQDAFFTVDTFPNKTFNGKVTQVRLQPNTSDSVVTYTVIVKVRNNERKLLPGMTANVSLILEKRNNVLSVPNSAFRFKPPTDSPQVPMGTGTTVAEVSNPAVYTLEDKKTVKKEVKKGITDGQYTEVISGIEDGEKVITGIVVPSEEK